MTDKPRPRRRGLLPPLSGDETGTRDLLLIQDATTSLEKRFADVSISDDFAFQTHLRFIAALHYFLGGTRFPASLAKEIFVPEATVRRWLDGQSAPVPRLRTAALKAGRKLLAHLELKRRIGASLYDVIKDGAD